ncbi:acyl carrier protein [Campylobacter sp. 9BO]|uniref:acyl carrier protein n=1 Tax=Campylobacter sp. 9BO TaxID=3424759 RepID=UPI003D340496
MQTIQNFFVNIDKAEVSQNMQNLVSDGIIDSLDIMALVAQIERHYKKPLDAKFIDTENFQSFEAISKMLKDAYE